MLYNFTYIKIFFLNVGWQKNLNKYKTIFLKCHEIKCKKNMQLDISCHVHVLTQVSKKL